MAANFGFPSRLARAVSIKRDLSGHAERGSARWSSRSLDNASCDPYRRTCTADSDYSFGRTTRRQQDIGLPLSALPPMREDNPNRDPSPCFRLRASRTFSVPSKSNSRKDLRRSSSDCYPRTCGCSTKCRILLHNPRSDRAHWTNSRPPKTRLVQTENLALAWSAHCAGIATRSRTHLILLQHFARSLSRLT